MYPGYHGESSNSSNCSLLREVKQEHFGENSVESSGENVQNKRIDPNNLISSLLKVLSENDTFKSEIQDKNAEIQKITKEKDSKIQELTNRLTIMKQRLIKANNDVFNKLYEKTPRNRSRSVGEEEIQRELNSNKLRRVISNNNETIAEYKNKQEAFEAENKGLESLLNDTTTELRKIQNLQTENENAHRKEKETLKAENQELKKARETLEIEIRKLKRKLDKANQEVNNLKKQRTEKPKNFKVFEGETLDTVAHPETDLSKYDSFPNLKGLTIRANQLSDILRNKPDLSKVTNLILYDSPKNPLDPIELINLLSLTKNVEILDLDCNSLIFLPKKIGNLRNLKKLTINNNSLTALPKEISNLQSLEYLYLVDNRLTELPEEIYTLPNLKELDIRNNPLKKLSREMFVFSNVKIFQ